MNTKTIIPGYFSFIVFIITLLAVGLSIFSSATAFAQNTEEENIKKVINASHNELVRGNLNGWNAAWNQDEKARITFVAKDFHQTALGWDSIVRLIKNTFNPQPNTNPMQLNINHLVIRANGNMATADYELTARGPQPDTASDRWHVFSTFVKENNEWKHTSLINTWLNSYTVDKNRATEDYLTRAAHHLSDAEKINEAIEVLKLNVKLFPAAWDAYNHLGEAYAKAGKKELAIKNYELSVKLNPKNEEGKEALAKLKQK